MCDIERERRAKRGASAKFFSAGHCACNAKPAYHTTCTNTYSWHILLFVSDATSCMACMCGIVLKRQAKRSASAKNKFSAGHSAYEKLQINTYWSYMNRFSRSLEFRKRDALPDRSLHYTFKSVHKPQSYSRNRVRFRHML